MSLYYYKKEYIAIEENETSKISPYTLIQIIIESINIIDIDPYELKCKGKLEILIKKL
jgi:hypothetical protein